MKISIIIPAYNESENIGRLIEYLIKNANLNLAEIIISDGSSEDDTLKVARSAGAIAVSCPERGRSAQMNYGASLAKGEIFYFVHADTIPPDTYFSDILSAISEGYEIGRYLSKYTSNSWLLKINALLSRIDTFAAMGGDQTLFISKVLFQKTDGFNANMKIMEEFEFCERARRHGKYKIINKSVLISARKYDSNGWLKVQLANFTVLRMYKKGARQESMVNRYKEMLNYSKLKSR